MSYALHPKLQDPDFFNNGYNNEPHNELGSGPYIAAAHEVKTKPTQHSVKELRSLGIQPDFIVCRSSHSVDDSIREKIANFCDVDADSCFFIVEFAILVIVLNHFTKTETDLSSRATIS